MGTYYSTTSKSLDDIDVAVAMRTMVNKTVTLLNYYKEIPVTYSAKLLDYGKDGIASLTCHPVQARLIDFDRYTIVRQGTYAFKADLVGMAEQSAANSGQHKMLLSRFLPVEIYTDKRELVRVLYDNPIDVTISTHKAEFSAKIIDSSANSFRIRPQPDLTMEVRDKARVSFILPAKEGPSLIEAEAVLVKAASEEQVFKMDVSSKQESTIMKFINQRQVEIIQELYLDYDGVQSPSGQPRQAS